MTIKHNQQIPHNHFRKDWQRRVRVHFDQAGKKKARRTHRVEKAARIAPRPTDRLRPVVRCPTIKYNRRARVGRGFSLQELKAAGVPRKLAGTIGISVDPRRQNISEESMEANVARLKEYMSRLILFPRRNGKQKKGDATAEEVKAAKSGKGVITSVSADKAFQFTPLAAGVTEGKVSDFEGEEAAFRKLRIARSDSRLVGVRDKRAKAKAEAEEAKKK